MGHAKPVPLFHPVVGDVGKLAFAVVAVDINSGKIADAKEVEVAVAVEVGKRCAVRAPIALGCEPGRFRTIRKIAVPVVDQ